MKIEISLNNIQWTPLLSSRYTYRFNFSFYLNQISINVLAQSRQPTLWLHNLILKFLAVYVNKFLLVNGQVIAFTKTWTYLKLDNISSKSIDSLIVKQLLKILKVDPLNLYLFKINKRWLFKSHPYKSLSFYLCVDNHWTNMVLLYSKAPPKDYNYFERLPLTFKRNRPRKNTPY